MVAQNRKKIGLALGAGGSKGLSHIGVIKELEKAGIVVDVIVGSSIGALVGGLYAATKDITQIEKIALSTNWQQVLPLFFDPSLRKGIIKGDKLRKFIHQTIGGVTFETSKITFGAVVTDMTDAAALCLTTGDYASAIRASISVPLLLQPVVIDKKVLVDGGLSMPVPVEFARTLGADIVIAVNLFEHYEGLLVDQKFGINAVTYKSSDILSHYLSLENVKTADIVISPNVSSATLFNKFLSKTGTAEVILEGELAMQAKIGELNKLLQVGSVPYYKRIGKLLSHIVRAGKGSI
jgi:NTE family protein